MTTNDLQAELAAAEAAVTRAEQEYSTCLLTGAGCASEQAKWEQAKKHLRNVKRKLGKRGRP